MDSVTRDLQLKIDAAFLGTTVTDGPSGIQSVAGATPIASDGFINLDPFFEAQSEAEALGATLTAFIASPATALLLASLKTNDTDSNQPLLLPTTEAATGAPAAHHWRRATLGVTRLRGRCRVGYRPAPVS